jgi:hypothetical protein
MFRFLTLLAFLEALTLVNGAVSFIEEQCQPVTFPSGAQQTLCFETQITTQSPNAGGVYVGDLAVNYKYSKVAAGIDTYVFWEYPGASECLAGEVIAEIGGSGGTIQTACKSCTFCDDGSVEADCTNLVKGRKVACGEGVVRGPVSKRSTPFFPYVLGKLVKANTPTKKPTKKPTMKMPTKKPTKKPTTPTKKPTKKPTMKMPTKKPTKTPTSILSCYYNSSWKNCQGDYPNPYSCDKFEGKEVCCRGDLPEGYLSSFGYCVAILD